MIAYLAEYEARKRKASEQKKDFEKQLIKKETKSVEKDVGILSPHFRHSDSSIVIIPRVTISASSGEGYQTAFEAPPPTKKFKHWVEEPIQGKKGELEKDRGKEAKMRDKASKSTESMYIKLKQVGSQQATPKQKIAKHKHSKLKLIQQQKLKAKLKAKQFQPVQKDTISDDQADFYDKGALKLIHKTEKGWKEKIKSGIKQRRDTGYDRDIESLAEEIPKQTAPEEKTKLSHVKTAKKSVEALFFEGSGPEKAKEKKDLDIGLLAFRDNEVAKKIDEKAASKKKKRRISKQRKDIPSSVSTSDEELFAEILDGFDQLNAPEKSLSEESRLKHLKSMIEQKMLSAEKKLLKKRKKKKMKMDKVFDEEDMFHDSWLGKKGLRKSIKDVPSSGEGRAKKIADIIENRLLDVERKFRKEKRKKAAQKKKAALADLKLLNSDEEIFGRYVIARKDWNIVKRKTPSSVKERAQYLEKLIRNRMVDGTQKLKKRNKTKNARKQKMVLSNDEETIAKAVLAQKEWLAGLDDAPTSGTKRAKYFEKLIQQRLAEGKSIINKNEKKRRDAFHVMSSDEEIAHDIINENVWKEIIKKAPSSGKKRVQYIEDLIQSRLKEGEQKILQRRKKKAEALQHIKNNQLAESTFGYDKWIKSLENAPTEAKERAKYMEDLIQTRTLDAETKSKAGTDLNKFIAALLDPHQWMESLQWAPDAPEERTKYLENFIRSLMLNVDNKLKERKINQLASKGIKAARSEENIFVELLLDHDRLEDGLANVPSTATEKVVHLEYLINQYLNAGNQKLQERKRQLQEDYPHLAASNSSLQLFGEFLVDHHEWTERLAKAPADPEKRAKYLDDLIHDRMLAADKKLSQRKVKKKAIEPSENFNAFVESLIDYDEWKKRLEDAASFSPEEKAKYLQDSILTNLLKGNRRINERMKAGISNNEENLFLTDLHEDEWKKALDEAPDSAEKRAQYLENLIKNQMLVADEKLNKRKKKFKKLIPSNELFTFADDLLEQKEWENSIVKAPKSAVQKAKYLKSMIDKKLLEADQKINARKKAGMSMTDENFVKNFFNRDEWETALEAAPTVPEEQAQYLQDLIQTRLAAANNKLTTKKEEEIASILAPIANENKVVQDLFGRSDWQAGLENIPIIPEESAKYLDYLIQNRFQDIEQKLQKRMESEKANEQDKFLDSLFDHNEWRKSIKKAPAAVDDRAKYLEEFIRNQLLSEKENFIKKEEEKDFNKFAKKSPTNSDIFLESLLGEKQWKKELKKAPDSTKKRAIYLEDLIQRRFQNGKKKLKERKKKKETESGPKPISENGNFLESLLNQNNLKNGIKNAPESGKERARYLQNLIEKSIIDGKQKLNDRRKKRGKPKKIPEDEINEQDLFFESLLGRNEFKKGLQNAPASKEKRAEYLEKLIKKRLREAEKLLKDRKKDKMNAESQLLSVQSIENYTDADASLGRRQLIDEILKAPPSGKDRTKYLQDLIERKLRQAEEQLKDQDGKKRKIKRAIVTKGEEEFNKGVRERFVDAPTTANERANYLEELIQSKLRELSQKPKHESDGLKSLEDLMTKRFHVAEHKLKAMKKKGNEDRSDDDDDDIFVEALLNEELTNALASMSEEDRTKQLEKLIEKRMLAVENESGKEQKSATKEIAKHDKDKGKHLMDLMEQKLQGASPTREIRVADHSEYVVNLRRLYSWELVFRHPSINPSRTAKRVSLHDNIASGSY